MAIKYKRKVVYPKDFIVFAGKKVLFEEISHIDIADYNYINCHLANKTVLQENHRFWVLSYRRYKKLLKASKKFWVRDSKQIITTKINVPDKITKKKDLDSIPSCWYKKKRN